MKFMAHCSFLPWRGITKTLRIMRITSIIILAASLQVSAKGYSQLVTLSVKNAALEKVLPEIERQTGYSFVYTLTDLQGARSIDLDVSRLPLEKVLPLVFADQPFTYSMEKNFIVIRPRPAL